MAAVKKVLEFLQTWRTRKQIEEEFNLSNTESFNLLRWLKKANEIEEKRLKIENHQNKAVFYKSKKRVIK